MKTAREVAARIWCDFEMSHFVMDVDKAERIALILAESDNEPKKVTQIHRLKTWPVYFQAMADGDKRFELRKNDRGFHSGDILILDEFTPDFGSVPGSYTGRSIAFKVGTMIQGEWGLEPDVCCMSLLPADWS